ncbi:MAG TPA: glycosyltransferase family 4 protein [Patescibacteria group bacterium]|nr:glycosyltransferase family 4 protein [Patescibacteria group bacterium]
MALSLHYPAAIMRIAQVAPLYEPVPPRLYGGTERVVSYLTEELVRRGHDVTLFASGDSQTSARLVALTERAVRLDASSREVLAADISRQLGRVFGHARDFDVIHCHVDYLAYPFSRLVRTPTLHTVHGRLDLPYLAPIFREFPDVRLISISEAQRVPLASYGVTWAGTVYHGMPLERSPFVAQPGEYLAFLGRLSPEKQPEVAIEVAKRVGMPLRIAAKIDANDHDYVQRVVAPLLDDPLIEFIGEVEDDRKAAFLGGARALLFPIDWPEPFGLVMIEAMACGTPVIARPCGSVPELLEDGRTGFLGDTVDDLVEAVKRIDTIERAECRRQVERRFSVARMVDDYEAIYRRAASARQAA